METEWIEIGRTNACFSNGNQNYNVVGTVYAKNVGNVTFYGFKPSNYPEILHLKHHPDSDLYSANIGDLIYHHIQI